MVRKVIAGQELVRASGTVTGKLVTWLAARGYIDRDSADHATGRAQDASRDLPVADRLGGLLHDVAERAPEIDVDALDDQDWVEDHLAISDVEPGRIWCEGGIGPIAVPRQASDLARPGWSVSVRAGTDQGQLAPARGRLRLPLTRGTPAPTRRRNTQTAPDPQLATARRAAAHSVVGQLAKPDRDQSLPPGVGEPALLKPRPTEPRSPLRRPQRGVPGGALETRRPGCRRRRSGRSMGHPFKDRPRALRPCARSRRPIGKRRSPPADARPPRARDGR